MSGALVVNIGTLTSPWISGAHAAVAGAAAPAGPGAGPGRRRRHRLPPRGCAGLDRAPAPDHPRQRLGDPGLGRGRRRRQGRRQHRQGVGRRRGGQGLAASTGAVVAATGAVDLVTDGTRTVEVANGHELLTRTTASGCALTALIGAWVAVLDDPLHATAGALAAYGVAAELAAAKAGRLRQLRPRTPRRAGFPRRRHRGEAGPGSHDARLRPRPLPRHRPRHVRRPRARAHGRRGRRRRRHHGPAPRRRDA